MKPLDRFRLIAAASLTDGKLGPAERKILDKAARDLKIEETTAEETIDIIREGGDVTAQIPTDQRERATLFRQLVDIVAADGVIEPSELALFKRLGPSFRLQELEVEDLLRSAADGARSATAKLKKKK